MKSSLIPLVPLILISVYRRDSCAQCALHHHYRLGNFPIWRTMSSFVQYLPRYTRIDKQKGRRKRMAKRSLCSFRSFTVGWKNSNCIIVEIFNSYLLRIHFVTKYCQIGEIVDPSSMHNFQYSYLMLNFSAAEKR